MGLFKSQRTDCYCAFCKAPRSVYQKKRLGAFNMLASGVCSLALMYTLWQKFDPRVFVFFGIFLAFAEIFVQLRWRVNIVCNHCGFDPVLYVKNPEKAAERVNLKLQERKNNPAKILARPLQLPKISQKRKDELEKMRAAQSGKTISRQV
ncbi:MAG: hypothetical protein LW875_10385 [Proteobacteria bacterium]|nr:hypothetical protein [Pseudomonadota bacterium]